MKEAKQSNRKICCRRKALSTSDSNNNTDYSVDCGSAKLHRIALTFLHSLARAHTHKTHCTPATCIPMDDKNKIALGNISHSDWHTHVHRLDAVIRQLFSVVSPYVRSVSRMPCAINIQINEIASKRQNTNRQNLARLANNAFVDSCAFCWTCGASIVLASTFAFRCFGLIFSLILSSRSLSSAERQRVHLEPTFITRHYKQQSHKK